MRHGSTTHRLCCVFTFIVACLAVQLSSDILCCWSKEEVKPSSALSVEADNEPLDKVLARVSKASGYTITVNKEAGDLPVSTSLKALTVYDAVKQIVGTINGPGYTLKAEQRKISIAIVNRSSESALSPASSVAPHSPDFAQADGPGAIEVAPPTKEVGRAITMKEVQASERDDAPPSPQTEAIPPIGAENPGVELWEAQAAGATEEGDDYLAEVIPPSKGQEAVTVGEMQAILDAAQVPDPSTIEVIPATESGGEGATLEEIQTASGYSNANPVIVEEKAQE